MSGGASTPAQCCRRRRHRRSAPKHHNPARTAGRRSRIAPTTARATRHIARWPRHKAERAAERLQPARAWRSILVKSLWPSARDRSGNPGPGDAGQVKPLKNRRLSQIGAAPGIQQRVIARKADDPQPVGIQPGLQRVGDGILDGEVRRHGQVLRPRPDERMRYGKAVVERVADDFLGGKPVSRLRYGRNCPARSAPCPRRRAAGDAESRHVFQVVDGRRHQAGSRDLAVRNEQVVDAGGGGELVGPDIARAQIVGADAVVHTARR